MSDAGGSLGPSGEGIAAELSALYEFSHIRAGGSEEELIRDAMQRATRIFGFRRAAAFDFETRRVFWSSGFPSEEQIWEQLVTGSEQVLSYTLCPETRPIEIRAECIRTPGMRERRLFLVFARHLEQAVQGSRNLQALAAAEKELRAHRDHLEKLVAQRTRELEESYRQLELEVKQRQQAERERMEMERQAAEARERELLERANRLSSLGVVAAGFAHEINNPLQGMLSHLRAVAKALPPDFPRRDNLQMVEQGIKTIADLVRQLLYFGAEGSTSRGTADLWRGLEFVWRMLKEEFGKQGVKIALPQRSRRVRLRIAQRDLIQVLLNLFLNARDAMPHGGTISVNYTLEGRWCHLTVADTGVGISRKLISRIFTPFFTTRPGKGTGLGLSVVESLVRSAGGRVDAESEPGRGTTFHIYLPMA